MAAPILICLVVGFLLRVWLFSSSLSEWLSNKNEVVTPITSWKRVTEGLALHRQGISPYSGDLFHEMPLLLRVLNYFTNMFGTNLTLFFVIIDILIALILERIAKHSGKYLLMKQAKEVSNYTSEAKNLIIKADDRHYTRLCVVACYLFNPYSIVTCVARSTAIFSNLAIALAMLFTIKGQRGKACMAIGVAAYLSFYPIMLVVPTALFIAFNESPGRSLRDQVVKMSIIQTVFCMLASLAVLLYLSFMLEKSWDFLGATYGFILTVPDLTPNIGLFWYFFTEMFEHFRLFFICVFQINAFIYTVPLAIKLKEHPLFQMYILVAIMGIFKSYPSYADSALYLSLLPIWAHTFHNLRNSFVVTCMFLVTTVLAPIQWHLWIYSGSANANFYFAITLAYSTAHVFLVTDLLFAFLRREHELVFGPKPEINGKQATVILD